MTALKKRNDAVDVFFHFFSISFVPVTRQHFHLIKVFFHSSRIDLDCWWNWLNLSRFDRWEDDRARNATGKDDNEQHVHGLALPASDKQNFIAVECDRIPPLPLFSSVSLSLFLLSRVFSLSDGASSSPVKKALVLSLSSSLRLRCMRGEGEEEEDAEEEKRQEISRSRIRGRKIERRMRRTQRRQHRSDHGWIVRRSQAMFAHQTREEFSFSSSSSCSASSASSFAFWTNL